MRLIEVDPARIELKARWERLLAGAAEVREAVSWTEDAMGSYVDEVTFQGLMRLHDLWNYPHAALDDESRERWTSIYRAWQEEVRKFEAAPAEWNRNYALAFIGKLPERMRERTAAGFVRDGMLTEDDLVDFRRE